MKSAALSATNSSLIDRESISCELSWVGGPCVMADEVKGSRGKGLHLLFSRRKRNSTW
jgi:hypothetical protein